MSLSNYMNTIYHMNGIVAKMKENFPTTSHFTSHEDVSCAFTRFCWFLQPGIQINTSINTCTEQMVPYQPGSGIHDLLNLMKHFTEDRRAINEGQLVPHRSCASSVKCERGSTGRGFVNAYQLGAWSFAVFLIYFLYFSILKISWLPFYD